MSDTVIVTVNEGKLRGFKQKSLYSGVEYYSFLGVPYGQPTDGKARFKDPVKVEPWNTILDATVERTGCKQYSIVRNMVSGSEDCLYNNIHTPKLPTSTNDPLKAVIVHVHPGGLYHGSADPHYYGSPEYFIHRDIVYVPVNYRLHILGFLNLGLEECSGNQGVKDVILSLRWIKENISNFGGDPENVTVLGTSSGSALVHCLLLSPSAKGLYHKAIRVFHVMWRHLDLSSEKGPLATSKRTTTLPNLWNRNSRMLMGAYVFCPVIVFRDNNAPVAHKIATRLGYEGPKGDNKKLLDFFKKIKMEQVIALRAEHTFNKSTLPVYPASPFMFTPDSGENGVLAESVRSLIPKTNRVPIIIGFCEREAALGMPFCQRMNKLEASKYLCNTLRHNRWGWGAQLNNNELNIIREEIESFYLNGESIEDASQSVMCDILTDAALSDVYESTINVISEDRPSDVYVYEFKYDGKLCVMKAIYEPTLDRPLKGTFHAAEYAHWCYVMEHMGKDMRSLTSEERQIIDTFTNLITTFAKTGNPNFEGLETQWKPTTPQQPAYLSIDTKLEMKEGVINGKRMEFWQNLKKKFNYE